MSDTNKHESGVGISYRALLPFEWHPVDESMDRQSLAASTEAGIEANEHCLRTIAILNEYPVDMSEEFHHLEFKMNLLLEMMGEVLASQLNLPPKALVTLTASMLEWQDEAAVLPVLHQPVRVDLYLHPQYPKPLSLTGKVESLQSAEAQQCRCVVRFDALPDGLNDQLEKFIFTHHRREIAHSRRHKP